MHVCMHVSDMSCVCFRYIGGQKEYEVELQFSSLLVNHPDRINLDGDEYKDSENPVLGSAPGSALHLDDRLDFNVVYRGANHFSWF